MTQLKLFTFISIYKVARKDLLNLLPSNSHVFVVVSLDVSLQTHNPKELNKEIDKLKNLLFIVM